MHYLGMLVKIGVFVSLTFGLMESAQAKKYRGRLVPGVWQQSWNTALKEALYAGFFLDHKKDKKAEEVCPGYSKSETKRKIFWHQLMVSLAYKESLHGHDNWIEFRGGINKGLYQVNPELKDDYGCDPYDLYNPVHNIRCAVKIAKRLTSRDGQFLYGPSSIQGMAAYWQPLRGRSEKDRIDREFILIHSVQAACASGKINYHSTTKHLAAFNPNQVGNILDDVNLSFNDTDAVLSETSQIDLSGQGSDSPSLPATFEFDSDSGMFFELPSFNEGYDEDSGLYEEPTFFRDIE